MTLVTMMSMATMNTMMTMMRNFSTMMTYSNPPDSMILGSRIVFQSWALLAIDGYSCLATRNCTPSICTFHFVLVVVVFVFYELSWHLSRPAIYAVFGVFLSCLISVVLYQKWQISGMWIGVFVFGYTTDIHTPWLTLVILHIGNIASESLLQSTMRKEKGFNYHNLFLGELFIGHGCNHHLP